MSIAAVALACNLAYSDNPKPPADWQAVDTHFGGLGLNGISADAEFRAAEFIQQRALSSHARVIVFPETAVPRWTEATDLFWQPTLNALASSGKTILVGTTFDIIGQPGYENGVVLRGARTGTFFQRVPVPFGMWNPLRSSSVSLHLFAPSVVTIGQRPAAVLICYEQFLTWPILKAATRKPQVLIGIANDYWARDTRIPALQRELLAAWGRLFGIPILAATNS